jgi:hypothetical protein
MNREEILQIVANHLQNNIDELAKSLENYRAASDLDEGDTKDMEDFSQQSESIDIQRQLQIQLDMATDTLAALTESGELVETNKNWFLMGLSIPAVPIGDKELLGISPESPAFAVINGKTKGDSFKLGTNTYKILSMQ